MSRLVRALLPMVLLLAVAPARAGEEKAAAAQPPAEESFCIQCHSNGDVWEKDQQRYFITAKDFGVDVHWRGGCAARTATAAIRRTPTWPRPIRKTPVSRR